MGGDSFLGLKSVAVLLVLLGALYFVNGILDVENYPIPGGWSVTTGILTLVAAYYIWKLKTRGWQVALGVFVVQLVGWAILYWVLVDSIIAAAGVSGPQADVIRTALSNRLNTSFTIGLLVALWVYPGRQRFVN